MLHNISYTDKKLAHCEHGFSDHTKCRTCKLYNIETIYYNALIAERKTVDGLVALITDLIRKQKIIIAE